VYHFSCKFHCIDIIRYLILGVFSKNKDLLEQLLNVKIQADYSEKTTLAEMCFKAKGQFKYLLKLPFAATQ
jgi:hypothetical protein